MGFLKILKLVVAVAQSPLRSERVNEFNRLIETVGNFHFGGFGR